MEVDFGLLGPLRTPSGPLTAAKHRILLASLLLRPGEPVTVEELAANLWDGDAPPEPKAAIQTYVRRLRQAVGASVVRTAGRGYLADVPPESVDVFRFRDLVAHAGSAESEVPKARLLRQALALWRGPALSDVPSRTLRETAGVALDNERQQTLEARFAAELTLDRAGDLVAELRVLTAEQPLNETFWAQLMLALVRGDRQAEALQVFREASGALAELLGTRPGQALCDLHQRILVGDIDLPRAPARSAPPPSVIPSQLPLDIVDFVGRAALVHDLSAAVRLPGTTALSGPPGVGKTALAIRVGHHVRTHFPDGQLYVDLRGFSASPPANATQVLPRLLRALGVPAEGIPTELAELSALFREVLRDRRVLLVLDNARDPEQIRPLMPENTSVSTLVTSRSEFRGIPGVTGFAVEVLPPADSQSLLRTMLGDAAVDEAPGAAAEMAALCAHLPLALRIASANLAIGGAPDIPAHVRILRAENRLASLSVIGDEQTAVRAAFDLSYASLDEEASQLFGLLGLVPGPTFTADAADALLGTSPEQAAKSLFVLRAAGLVQDNGSGRMSMHDLVSLYGRERLGGEEPTAQRRLLHFYLGATDAAAAKANLRSLTTTPERSTMDELVPRFADKASALAWLDEEWVNVVAAARVATTSTNGDLAWRLVEAVRRYLDANRYLSDVLGLAEAALVWAREHQDHIAVSTMHMVLGACAYQSADFRKAVTRFRQAKFLAATLGLRAVESHATSSLTAACLRLGKLEEARQHGERALALAREESNGHIEMMSLLNLSAVHWLRGDPAGAINSCQEALTVGGEEYFEFRLPTVLNLAVISRDIGDYPTALANFERALVMLRSGPDTEAEAAALEGLAVLYNRLGEPERAQEYALLATEISMDKSVPRLEAQAHHARGESFELLGELDQALAQYEQGLAITRRVSAPDVECQALHGLASVHHTLGNDELALRLGRQSLALAEKHGLHSHAARARLVLGRILLVVGDLAGCGREAVLAMAAYERSGHRPGHANAEWLLGDLEIACGRASAARDR